jgi:hypothetical protein
VCTGDGGGIEKNVRVTDDVHGEILILLNARRVRVPLFIIRK